MAENKPKILIIEDDLDVAEMLNAYFRVQGYEVLTANWGEDGVKSAQEAQPDLIILDIRLPDIDGYEVASRLRAGRGTQNIPVIFLTEKRIRDDRLKGLELGADDYITKPFDIQELRLRVRNSLKRNAKGNLNNPITEMPEGLLVDEHLAACLSREDETGMLLISLKNLEHFRETYGFVASDDVLRAVSLMIQSTSRYAMEEGDFFGHLDTTRFLLTMNPEHIEPLQEKILTRLMQSLDYFYPLKARDSRLVGGKRLDIAVGRFILTPGTAFPDVEGLKNHLKRR